jgi:hypothetical protein
MTEASHNEEEASESLPFEREDIWVGGETAVLVQTTEFVIDSFDLLLGGCGHTTVDLLCADRRPVSPIHSVKIPDDERELQVRSSRYRTSFGRPIPNGM